VAAGAVVTYRTFRQNQLDQANRQVREERTYKLNESHEVTDTYTKAVERLGHNEAPVRLGAMYSLERLAQDNPPRRQTVVDVLCAYLRMPYTLSPPGESAADDGSDAPTGVTEPATVNAPRHDPAQELQVRQTAQRLLAAHLHRPPGISHEDAHRIEPSPTETFWPGIRLDLTGATLVDLDLSGISVKSVNFVRATFSGYAWFYEATFSGYAGFDEATFFGNAGFVRATFSWAAAFNGATFYGAADYGEATFYGAAQFNGVRVFHLDDPDLNRGGWDAPRVWPEGWTVRPDADDPSRGTLVSSATGLSDSSTRGCP
jgi:hypothetical protein